MEKFLKDETNKTYNIDQYTSIERLLHEHTKKLQNRLNSPSNIIEFRHCPKDQLKEKIRDARKYQNDQQRNRTFYVKSGNDFLI